MHIRDKHLIPARNVAEAQQMPTSSKPITSTSRGCNVCGANCRDEEQLSNHMKKKHSRPDPATTTCNLCGAVCGSKAQLSRHRRKKHLRGYQDTVSATQPKQEDKAQNDPTRTFHCDPCDKTFKSQSALVQHSMDKHQLEKTTIKCNLCSKSVRTQSGLKQHQTQKHGIQTTDDGSSDSSDDSSDYESELSDDGDAMRWPEHGEPVTGLVRCLCRIFGCRKRFNWASEMLYHAVDCSEWLLDECEWDLFDEDMKEEGRRLRNTSRSSFYKCYKCENQEDPEKFNGLEELYRHAESGLCALKVRTGPLSDVRDALELHAFRTNEQWDREYKEPYSPDYDYYDGYHWPEHGEIYNRRVRCLGAGRGCKKTFSKASEMLQHIEGGFCEAEGGGIDIRDLFLHRMGDERRRIWGLKTNFMFRCPLCPRRYESEYEHLSGLFAHAESDFCGLKVRTGPLSDVRSALLSEARRMIKIVSPHHRLNLHLGYMRRHVKPEHQAIHTGGTDSDDEELRDYRMTGDISMSYLERYGYY
ncbi:hypothetical protein FPOA_00229 [Fusarium poae]|uniref:C2H2-type domain-containing protein n=1 Tax=Fusarium poae TaxID=36050 RepID=A0A1B8B0M9_FUSPO|nr:hypothetical protein FPOA_00229 [Fusarium poae]